MGTCMSPVARLDLVSHGYEKEDEGSVSGNILEDDASLESVQCILT